MDVLHQLMMGFQVAATPINLLWALIGAFVGTIVGVLPGIGPLGSMAILLSFTLKMDATTAMIFFAGIYYGAMYGGSTTSILLNIPGEAASVVTCIDGYKMAQKGRAGAALTISAVGSFVTGTLSIIGLMFAAFYAAFGHFGGAPQHDFFVDKQPANPQTFQYFSFTTLTTLGYGDFTAGGDSGRALAVLEALTGQVFLAILVARLVAAYRAPAAPPPPASGRHVPPGTVWRGPATRRPKPAASVRRTVSRPKEPPGRRAP